MKKLVHALAFFLLLIASGSCNPSIEERKFPPLTNINKFPGTIFVESLDEKIPDNKNVIYTPVMLLAWEKAKSLLGCRTIISEGNSEAFKLFNLSKSFENSLKENEFEANAELAYDTLAFEAVFMKSLPFNLVFEKLQAPILFQNVKVKAFGKTFSESDPIQNTKVLFYENDNKFIIKLFPKDPLEEIILAKGFKLEGSLKNIIIPIEDAIKKGEKESLIPKLSWKYVLTSDDNLSVPILKFNIESNLSKFRGQEVNCKGKKYHVGLMNLHTEFILDEKGAEVESDISTTDSASAIKHPKKLEFNSPFLILMKKTGNYSPYFVMKVNNPELMVKM